MVWITIEKKRRKKSFEAQNVGLRLQNLCRTVTVWKELNLLNKFSPARDDTRLSLHGIHGTVSLHWTVASSVRWAYHAQRRRTLACTETLVISQVSVQHYCFLCYLHSRFHCWVAVIVASIFLPQEAKKQFHFTFTFAGLNGVFFPIVPCRTRHFALRYVVTKSKHSWVNWHGHTSAR